MRHMKRRLLALEEAWKVLDSYAVHASGCPLVWGNVGACDCGLTAARVRLREAVLALLNHYAFHDDGCPGATGGRCTCGFDSTRRRLQEFAGTYPSEVPADSLPKRT